MPWVACQDNVGGASECGGIVRLKSRHQRRCWRGGEGTRRDGDVRMCAAPGFGVSTNGMTCTPASVDVRCSSRAWVRRRDSCIKRMSRPDGLYGRLSRPGCHRMADDVQFACLCITINDGLPCFPGQDYKTSTSMPLHCQISLVPLSTESRMKTTKGNMCTKSQKIPIDTNNQGAIKHASSKQQSHRPPRFRRTD